jgi:thioredoxin-like negative regulator of GroEL
MIRNIKYLSEVVRVKGRVVNSVGMNLTEAGPETFDELVRASGPLVVAYFWGHECPNCEVFARDLPALLDGLPAGVKVVKVNAYEHPELARRYALAGIPAFVLFKEGKKLGMMRQYYGRDYWSRVVAEQAQGERAVRPVEK